MPGKNETPEQNNIPLKKFVDEVTKNKIERHLTDINDTISEEDIKNINTDISSSGINPSEEKNSEEKIEKDEPAKEAKENSVDKEPIPTSWNILDQ